MIPKCANPDCPNRPAGVLAPFCNDCVTRMRAAQPSPRAVREPGSVGDFAIGSRVWPGTSKLVEEMGELQQVLGKLIATGGDTDHWSGDLRRMLVEELGDVSAAVRFFAVENLTLEDGTSVASGRTISSPGSGSGS